MEFLGSETSQYKQIGNAVPVNLAHALGRSLIRLLNEIYQPENIKAQQVKDKSFEQIELMI